MFKAIGVLLMLLGSVLLLGLVAVFWLVSFHVVDPLAEGPAFVASFLSLAFGAFSLFGGAALWSESRDD